MSHPLEEFPKLRRWAVVGVSQDQSKYGNKIYRDLRGAGYEVYPVHPKLTEVEGAPCYPSLSALPVKPDVVDLVVPPTVAESVVEECHQLGIQNLWFQPGSESDTALKKAEGYGMNVVANACIMIQKQAWPE